ncbi:MAG: VOC family protein [Anaerolineaceae bacterium]|jgi:catechol 2,3-dioxygenase-like lactoylglutathione lyase family enzyme
MRGLLKMLQIVSYPVSNWQASKKFYGETLGLPVAFFMGDEAGWMEFGDKKAAHLAIMPWPGPGPLPPHNGGAIAVFKVSDAFAAVKELRKRGVKCDDAIPVPGMITYANFYDPDGYQLQIAGPAPKA